LRIGKGEPSCRVLDSRNHTQMSSLLHNLDVLAVLGVFKHELFEDIKGALMVSHCYHQSEWQHELLCEQSGGAGHILTEEQFSH